MASRAADDDTFDGRQARRNSARIVVQAAEAHARTLGVDLAVEWNDEKRRLDFCIARADGPKGNGAMALRRLLHLADEAGIEVSLDVLQSLPALVRYYWRFGFRLSAGDRLSETRELDRMIAEREAIVSRNPDAAVDFGVTTMWRDAGAGPLLP